MSPQTCRTPYFTDMGRQSPDILIQKTVNLDGLGYSSGPRPFCGDGAVAQALLCVRRVEKAHDQRENDA